ncbi:hypothetical protein PMIN06_011102 [Paraphaeosphaeria minitans]
MNGANVALGYAAASYMSMVFYFAESDAAKWRGPLGIPLLWLTMMKAVMFISADPPRFLNCCCYMDDVHIFHDMHQLVYRMGNEKDRREHVATRQGGTSEVERAIKAKSAEPEEIVGTGAPTRYDHCGESDAGGAEIGSTACLRGCRCC